MIDIAEKLREAYYGDLTDMPLLNDAAEEIEKLRAKLKAIAEDERVPNWIRKMAE